MQGKQVVDQAIKKEGFTGLYRDQYHTGPFSPFLLPMIMVVKMLTSLPLLLTFLQWFRANGLSNGL